MHTVAIVGAGTMISGDVSEPRVESADTIVCRDGVITHVGRQADLAAEIGAAGQQIDVQGATVAPGLIDSHGHVTLADYAPRQKAVDYLAGYLQGGITRTISAGELHVPGRPRDREGVKALAIAARACFENYRPGGMRVHAGCVILEPTLTESDFDDLAGAGVRLAKFGFGAYQDPLDGLTQVRWARERGLTVMCHCGGASAAGSMSLRAEQIVALAPQVCGHVNGGPTALPDGDSELLLRETQMVLQLVHAGNLRSALRVVRLAADHGQLGRIVLGSDTPSGVGVIPLSMLKLVVDLSALATLDPAVAWALATGNNAGAWQLPAGRLRVGEAADLVVLDPPLGSAGESAIAAMAKGDIPAITAVVSDGRLRSIPSRMTPKAARVPVVTEHSVPMSP